jgi:uncharacterized protein (DUF924 family)
MPGQGEQAAEVLEFWFVQSRPRQWFAKGPAFDALVGGSDRADSLLTSGAAQPSPSAWGSTPRSSTRGPPVHTVAATGVPGSSTVLAF